MTKEILLPNHMLCYACISSFLFSVFVSWRSKLTCFFLIILSLQQIYQVLLHVIFYLCQKCLLSIFCSPLPVLWFPSSCCIPDCSLGLPQSCVRIFLLAILTSGLENVIPWIDPHLSVTVTACFFFCDLAVFEEFPVLQNRGTLYSIHIQNWQMSELTL